MKTNYLPWRVNIDDFFYISDKRAGLEFLLKFAVLAPSSHNSQPWRFFVKNNAIEVELEEKRRLIESDKNDRQAYISIGCAVKNILIAADYYGYENNIQISEDNNNNPIKISLSKLSSDKKSTENHLISYITKRTTNRHPYKSESVPQEFLNKIKNLESNSIKIFITSGTLKNKIAGIALSASITAMEDKNFRFELSQYVKPNPTSSPVCMPCFGMGIPTPVSFLVPTLLKYFNMNKLSHKKDGKLLKEQTSNLVVIATEKDNRENWIKTGMIYQEIALLAEQNGLNTAMWAAPIQTGEFYMDLQKELQTNLRPQALFRLGYAEKDTPHSPRLGVEKVLR